MAWTEQCKIDARKQIDVRKDEVGSVRQACKILAKESGIPARTLEHWWRYEERDENSSPEPPKKITKADVAKRIIKNLGKAIKAEKEQKPTVSAWKGAVEEDIDKVTTVDLAQELTEQLMAASEAFDLLIEKNKDLGYPLPPEQIDLQLSRLFNNNRREEDE